MDRSGIVYRRFEVQWNVQARAKIWLKGLEVKWDEELSCFCLFVERAWRVQYLRWVEFLCE